MKIIGIFLAVIGLFNSGCITTHVGEEIQGDDGGFTVSCSPRSDMSEKHFDIVSCTVENNKKGWLDVKVKSLTFPGDEKSVVVSSPYDIQQFKNAYAYESEKAKYNRDLILGSLIVVGYEAAVGGGQNERFIGAGTALGATAAAGAIGFKESYNRAQYAKTNYSDDHLLGEGFRVPPEMFIRKFALIEVKNGRRRPKTMTICFEKPTSECLTLPLGKASLPLW